MAESREQIAQREVGHTDIPPWLSRALVAVFLTTLLVVPALQTAYDFSQHNIGDRDSVLPQYFDALRLPAVGLRAFFNGEGGPLDRLFAANREVLRSIHAFDDSLEQRSRVGQGLRQRLQQPLTEILGVGNEQVYRGRSQWLFYRPAVDHLTGRGFLDEHQMARRAASGNEWQEASQPNPLPAILDFRDQLARRGIELVIMPVPVKASIHPDLLSSRYIATGGAVHNPSFGEFLTALEAEDVRVFDPTSLLLEASASSGEAQYLAADTHWTPDAVNLVAKELAVSVRSMVRLPKENKIGFTSRKRPVQNVGDLAEMLELTTLFPAQTVYPGEVKEPTGSPSRKDLSPEVMFLGDSFANIYQQEGLGWGTDAGLAQRLGFHLRHPIDALIRNDDGAFATRLLLSQEIKQNSERLAATRVLIWEFTARELSTGDWRSIPLALENMDGETFVDLPAGASIVVEGTIAALSDVPDPRGAPYADFIIGMHLVDLTSGSSLDGNQALVFAWAMRGRQLTSGADYRVGQRLRLQLRPWADVGRELRSINRGELYDNNLFLQPPCWGEEVSP